MEDDQAEQISRRRKRRGECQTCGTKTHEKRWFRRKKPLTVPGQALYGRCLVCHPLEGYAERRSATIAIIENRRRHEYESNTESTLSEVTLDCSLQDDACQELLRSPLRHLSWDQDISQQKDEDSPWLESLAREVNDTEPTSMVYKENGPYADDVADGGLDETLNLSCCICSCESIEPSQVASINNCQHLFCFACIERWAEYENTCPLCKVRFNKIIRTNVEEWNNTNAVKKVPYRKQPSNNNIMAPFEARSVATMEAFGSYSMSSIENEMEQLFADIEALTEIRRRGAPTEMAALQQAIQPPPTDRFEDIMEMNDDYEAAYEYNLLRQRAIRRHSLENFY